MTLNKLIFLVLYLLILLHIIFLGWGNVYLSGDGLIIFNIKVEQIEHVAVPENWTANVTFGGLNQETLFITAMDFIYTLEMVVHW